MTWHRKLPLPGSVAQRTRAASERGSDKLRTRAQIIIRRPEQAFYRTFSTDLFLNGYRVKIATRYQIAKLFGIGLPAVIKWGQAGVLPEPLMYQERGSRKYPIYLAGQVRCLILVVNDLVRDGGYMSIPWAYLPDHIAMLHEGYEKALVGFQRRAGYFDEEPLGDEEMPDKFGVTFD